MRFLICIFLFLSILLFSVPQSLLAGAKKLPKNLSAAVQKQLKAAIMSDNVANLSVLLREHGLGANTIIQHNEYLWSPLQFSVLNGKVNIVKHLVVDLEARTDDKTRPDATPLLEAAKGLGYTEIAKIIQKAEPAVQDDPLLSASTAANPAADSMQTHYEKAAQRGDMSTLLDYLGNTNSPEYYDVALLPILVAAVRNGQEEVVRYTYDSLLSYKDAYSLKTNHSRHLGSTGTGDILLDAVKNGQGNIVEMTFDYLSKLNEFTISTYNIARGREHSIIMTALGLGHMDILELLFKHLKILPEHHSSTISAKQAESLLGVAVGKGNKKMLEFLIENFSLLIKVPYSAWVNALMFAARKGHLEIVEFLVANTEDRINYFAEYSVYSSAEAFPPIDVNEVDEHARTVLYYAEKNNHREIAEFLLKHGADPSYTKSLENVLSLGKKAYITRKGGRGRIVRLLFEYGAELDDLNLEGYGSVWRILVDDGYSIDTGYFDIDTMKVLLEFGADIQARDIDGYTPLELAEEHENYEENYEVAEFIRAYIKNLALKKSH